MLNETEARIDAYLAAFARLVEAQPGTPHFAIEQAALDVLWESLSIEEKSEAYDKAAPYRKRLAHE